ncbi:thioredoxin-disulfide reductase [Candidatus Micrarchaeota archaeon]|nr:thioredoxin-disulfide reductase [Candidatus Micrarchaeota archaeon]
MLYDLIILGAGPAGLSAAIYASRDGLNILVLDKGIAGGQIASTELVENYPGFESVSGQKLTSSMLTHAKKFGAEIQEAVEIKSVHLEGKIKKITSSKGEFQSKSIMLATGSREKKLGIKGESELKGKGVSYCATCDAPFFKEKEVVVIGGGNSALAEAIHLSKFAKTVIVIHRRSVLRADKILQKQAQSNPKIKFILNSTVEEIIGSTKVEAITLKDTKTSSISSVKCDGIFIYIGMLPNTELFKEKLKLDKQNQIIIDDECKTNIPGVFAAGDVTNSKVKQVVTAAGSGAIAAISASKFISEE